MSPSTHLPPRTKRPNPLLSLIALVGLGSLQACIFGDSNNHRGRGLGVEVTDPNGDFVDELCVEQGEEVQFHSRINGFEAKSFVWSFGDPTIPDQTVREPAPVTFLTKGTWEVRLLATGDSVSMPDSMMVTVKTALVARIIPEDEPIQIFQGDIVKLNALVDTGTRPYNYEWFLEGKSFSVLEFPDPVKFNDAGTFHVALRVTDANGFVEDVVRTVSVSTGASPCVYQKPAALAYVPPGYVRDPSPNYLMVGDELGFGACDLVAGVEKYRLTDRFSVRLLEPVMVNDGVNERYGVFTGWDPSGFGLTFYDKLSGAASFTITSSLGTVSHLSPFDDHAGLLLTSIGSNQVSAYTYDAGFDTWLQTGLWLRSHFPGASGNVAFAATRGPNQATYYVTDGMPAAVWSAPDWSPSIPAVYRADAGDAPRDALLEGDIFAVANNSSRTLNTYITDTLGNVTPADQINIGAAIAMDSRPLSNGNLEFAVACEPDELWFVEVDPVSGMEIGKTSHDTSTRAPGLSDVRYVNDEWTAVSSLTLNVPIRWE